MAVGADFQFPQMTGPKPRGTDIFAWYLSRLIRRAHDDSRLRDALFEVINLERPPTALLQPRSGTTIDERQTIKAQIHDPLAEHGIGHATVELIDSASDEQPAVFTLHSP